MIEESFGGTSPGFMVVEQHPENLVQVGPKVLTTVGGARLRGSFESICIVPSGGPLRTPSSSSNGVNYWQEPSVETEYSSAELLAHFAKIGAEPRFTVIEG